MFIWRLTPQTDRLGKRATLITILFIILTFVGSIFQSLLSCQPYSAAWNLSVRLYDTWHCAPIWIELVAWNAIYAATDLWLILLPLRLIKKLQLARSKKLALMLIFTLGLLATICAALKISVIKHAYTSYDINCLYPQSML
jgi:hypothetical protein